METQNLLPQHLSYMQPKSLVSIANDLKIDFDSADKGMKELIRSGRAAVFAQGCIKLATSSAHAACCAVGGDDDDGRGSGRVEVPG